MNRIYQILGDENEQLMMEESLKNKLDIYLKKGELDY